MKPYHTEPGATLYQGDCLEVLWEIPQKSVDLVFCSPPYEAARTYGIEFKLRGQDWVDWAIVRYLECLRICRGLTCWIVEGQTRQFRYSATPLLLAADLHRIGVKLRKPPVFQRVGIPGSGGPDWLRNDYEFAICASEGKLPWSDNTAMGHPPKWGPGGEMSHRLSDGSRRNQWGGVASSTGGTRHKNGQLKPNGSRPSHTERYIHTKRKSGGQRGRDGMHNQEFPYSPPVKANPGNVIRCKVGGGQMGSKLCHENEAPFPETLVEFFVRSFCPPGGVVLDPFCGSGTTVAVARKLGREAIGIDLRESQMELTLRRLREVSKSLTESQA